MRMANAQEQTGKNKNRRPSQEAVTTKEQFLSDLKKASIRLPDARSDQDPDKSEKPKS